MTEALSRQRIDKLLWHLRLAASRSVARSWVETGHIRVNGRRVERPAALVAAGDVLTLPMRQGVRVIAVVALPHRRGPAPEAQACYQMLDQPRIPGQSAAEQHPAPEDLPA